MVCSKKKAESSRAQTFSSGEWKRLFGLVLMLCASLYSLAQVEEAQVEEEVWEEAMEEEDAAADEYIYEDYEYQDYESTEPEEEYVPRREKVKSEDVQNYTKSDLSKNEIEDESWRTIIGEADYDEIDPDIDPEEKKELIQNKEAEQSSPIWQWLMIVLIVIALIYVIYRLSENGVVGNQKVNELDLASLDKAEENIQESDLERLLRLALEAKDYRSALRVRYLMVLKQLDTKGWITHRKDKTSMSYIIEMDGRTEQARFRELSRIFDYVWYAEVDVPAEDDALFARRFSDYMRTIDG